MNNKKVLYILGAIILLLSILLLCSFWFNTDFRNNTDSITAIESNIPSSVNSDSKISELGLTYKVYDGSGDSQIKRLFNDPTLYSIQSGTQTLAENVIETGNGNINVGGETFSIDKKSEVYIKLITDTEVSAFLFNDEQLKKFQNYNGEDYDMLKAQDVNNFIPLKSLSDSYSVVSLDPGIYVIVVVPTKKAVTFSTEIKLK